MPLLESYVINLFNDNLADSFVDIIIDYANKFLAKAEPISFLDYSAKIAFDQRWIGDLVMADRQFTVTSSALAGSYAGGFTLHGRPLYPDVLRANYKINADITYEISINSFKSAFSFVGEKDHEEIYQALGILELKVEVLRIVATGFVINISFVQGG